MKARGIINSTRRLLGAKQLGSAALIAKAELDGHNTLSQAQIWLTRTVLPTDEAELSNHQMVVEAVEVLERVLAGGKP